MKRLPALLLLLFLAALLFAVPLPKFEPLPTPLSNNAVAAVKSRGSLLLYSFMGIGPQKTWDAVAGVYHDRFIYLVSGWSKTDAVRDVQIYDAEKNKWLQGTRIPGTPVFGHAGGLVGDTIVYVDGAQKNPSADQPKYVASDECWMGKIDHHDPAKILWTKLPTHPGNARYRIAAGSSEKDQMIYFSGGTDNPYNFNGIGYDGKPSEPSPVTFE